MDNLFSKIVNHRYESSLATSFRLKRFELFLSLIAPLPKPMKILDLGGEQRFWEVMGLGDRQDYQFVILNIYPPVVTRSNFRGQIGDATDLGDYSDGEFDFVFSNSVIEHLGSYTNQQRMACEVRRVGRNFFVQTPNKYFPLEPHFLVPFFQFFPINLQVALTRRFNLGWYQKIPDKEEAKKHVLSHRLLTEGEMRDLFPDGHLYKEKVLGFTKSFISYGPNA